MAGNLIGTNVTGSVALGNLFDTPALYGGFGVDLNYSPDTIVGEPGGRNVISGNGAAAPAQSTAPTSSCITRPAAWSRATTSAPTSPGPSPSPPIPTTCTSEYGSSITIGGLTPTPGTGLGNVISGNTGEFGIGYRGRHRGTVAIEGNIIGADATGEHALPNAMSGVFLYQASGVTIGGTAAGSGEPDLGR